MTLGDLRQRTAHLDDSVELFVWAPEPIEDPLPGAIIDWCGGAVTSIDVVHEGDDPTAHVELYHEC